ncbi:MAG TPA: hypothetical protein VK766_02800, partial [Cytophagaceae bacterium]|nr:hypothetical protein [Cytophagaceae bacterium]
FLGIWLLLFFYQKFFDKSFLFSLLLMSSVILVLFCSWYFGIGKEGRFIMAMQNARIQESVSPDFRPTLKGLFFGTLAQSAAIFGNYLGMLGFKIKEVILLSLFPFLLILLTYKKLYFNIRREYFFLITGVIIFNLLFDIGLAIKSDHNVSFWPRYAIFSVPFASLLLGYSMYSIGGMAHWKKSVSLVSVLILFFTMLVSDIAAFTGYLGSYDQDPTLRKKIYALDFSDFQKEPYQKVSEEIKSYCQLGDTVVYKSWFSAQNTNLYLEYRADLIQKVDTGQIEEVKFGKMVILKVDSPYYKH